MTRWVTSTFDGSNLDASEAVEACRRVRAYTTGKQYRSAVGLDEDGNVVLETEWVDADEHVLAFESVPGLEGTLCVVEQDEDAAIGRASVFYLSVGDPQHLGRIDDRSGDGGIPLAAAVADKYGFTPVVLRGHVQELLRERYGQHYRTIETLFYACRYLATLEEADESTDLADALAESVRGQVSAWGSIHSAAVETAVNKGNWAEVVSELRPRVRRPVVGPDAFDGDDAAAVLASLDG